MDTDKSAVLLEGILDTLKLIHTGIQAQEKRWEWLEKRLGEPETREKLAGTQRGSEDGNLIQDVNVRHRSWPPVADTVAFVERSRLPPLLDDDGDGVATSPGVEIAETNPMHSDTQVNVEESDAMEDIQPSRPSKSLVLPESECSTPPRNSLEQLQRSAAWRLETTVEKVDKVKLVDYRDWNSPLADSPLQLNRLVQRELGDAWTIPYDSRLTLIFSRSHLENLNSSQVERLLPVLAAFRDKMKPDGFVDFKIVDRVGRHQITYRLGEPTKIRGHPRVPIRKADDAPEDDLLPGYDHRFTIEPDAPWTRFIFCQGLNTGQLDLDEFHLPKNEVPNSRAPFLSGTYRSKGWRNWFTSVSAHIRCKRLALSNHSDQINHYKDYGIGFHITFFEILSSYLEKHPKFEERGRWKHGPLYGGIGEEERLCESSFTIIEIPGFRKRLPGSLRFRLRQPAYTIPVDTWTVMLLSPPRFFGRAQSTPSCMNQPMHSVAIDLLHFLFRDLKRIWTVHRDHLERLLDDGDALFNPPAHDKLLWDDEVFTRSRKYFWAIHCLTEFHLSITDNILQWDNYNEARIEPLRKGGFLSGSDLWKLDELEESITTMKNVRLYFSEKLISTKALRDGLFNASAVVESRASTRLGENVKLLTLVSIFFLPLAFCTSLWSINTLFSTTTLIYTIIIIGLSTYLIVFNLNNIVLQVSKSYKSLRDRLIKKMKGEDRYKVGFWPQKGVRFDVFKPVHERAHPSEWWLVIFVFHLMFVKVAKWLQIHRLKTGDEDNDEDSYDNDSTISSIVSSTSDRLHSSLGSTRSSSSQDPAASENDVAHHEQDNDADKAVELGEMKPGPSTTAPLYEPVDGSVGTGIATAMPPIPESPQQKTEKLQNTIGTSSTSQHLSQSVTIKRRSLAEKALSKILGRKKSKVALDGNGFV